jgi:nickel-dependent lactate racemase
MIEAAADLVPTSITAICPVVVRGEVSAIFGGDRREAWTQAVQAARESHIIWVDEPFERVISCAPPMYDELWTAAKAVYKLEPALADGAEIILHAPHLDTVSRSHGRYIREVGYHVLPYFLEQWERFARYPLAVLAHSTHLKGAGTFHDGVERPRVTVKLASRISADECRQLNLGYVDPQTIDAESPPQGWTVIANAGEDLYRVRD